STSLSPLSHVSFTIVPIPHLLCFALSPTFHVACSAPVVVIFSAFFRGGTDCDERFGLERLFFNICAKTGSFSSCIPSNNSAGISEINRLIGFIFVLP